jgi:excinuclease ABC subunit C
MLADKSTHLQEIIRHLPDKPGVYQYFNSSNQIIYVGKAKSLRKRVSSYFNKDRYENGKTAMLVKRIADISYIVVDTELDALLLENNLIKKHQPRYNVLLKDDKTFPWICIRNERFPRVYSTRNVVKDGSVYFGPYASVKMVNTLLDLITQLFQIRNCSLDLSESNIQKHKFKACLEFHIGNCKAPCEGRQTQGDYDETIAEIKEIIKGNINTVIQHLKTRMGIFSSNYDFENAQAVKEKLDILEKFRSKSVIVNPSIHNADVFSIVTEEDFAFVNFMKVMNGAIIQAHTVEMRRKLDETPEELLEIAVTEIRDRFRSDAREIIVPFSMPTELPGILFTVPKIGDKKHLLDLSEKNVRYYMKERLTQYEKLDPDLKLNRTLEQMKKDLRLQELPVHIECFDNSNIQGAYPVAAMSVFKNAKPSKSDYRHFNIRTVEGPDDFASMEEIIYRRYKRLLEENASLPQLIVIDGGKGQLGAALNSLEKLGLRGKISIIGIAKRLEEIYYPGDPVPLYLDKKSETLRIIQHLRDEVHRFGITHHRNKRSKGVIKTELSEIKGIGDTIAAALLKHFKSVKRIREASLEEIEAIAGKAKGKIVYAHFHTPTDPGSA